MKLYYFTFAIVTLIGISGCTNTPSHLIIAPDIMETPNISYSNKQIQLNVTDMRTSNHIVQVMRKGEAATLISAEKRLEKTIKNTLNKHWIKQGLSIQDGAINSIKISIEKAVISVNQEMMKYKVQSEIVLKITITNGSQTLTNTFRNRGNSEGPLKADIAVLERNFNQRLANLLQQILANKKISNFL
jgi:uncharacterized lipoprotein